MLRGLGRVLQFVGLIILPVAMAGEIAQRLNLKECLMMASAGVAVFYVGWLLQQSSGSR